MLFETFTAIGRALYATRSGHEAGDVEYAKPSSALIICSMSRSAT
jgi:hypothetical protein